MALVQTQMFHKDEATEEIITGKKVGAYLQQGSPGSYTTSSQGRATQ